MKLLVLTTLFPSAAMPSHGIFVENRLLAIRAETNASVKVIAPVPWFPSKHEAFGSWSQWAKVKTREVRESVEVLHPRYFLPPKVGMTYAATALEQCFDRAVREQLAAGYDFDLIDAHYYYPDGVAAVRVARTFNKPVVVTARGTDINLIPSFARQRRMILEAASKADMTITVAEALRAEMLRLGAVGEKIVTLRNGVDLATFRPVDRSLARQQVADLGARTFPGNTLPGEAMVLASVGHLIERKGHDLVIDALGKIPHAHLLIAGDGPERPSLERQVQALSLGERVHFLGRVPHEALSSVYSAADITVLASSREGWPNVLLESMASGTPCVATPVWGSGEVITAPAAGMLCTDRSALAIAEAVTVVNAAGIDRAATRGYAEQFSWDETAQKTARLYARIIETHQRRNAVICKPALNRERSERPRAIVTIDTEEAFNWADFTAANHSVGDLTNLGRFQQRCSQQSIKPIYFLTCPMLSADHGVAFFNDLAHSGSADLGLHMHQWVTPPETRFGSSFYSYQCNLPDEVLREKFRHLISLFIGKFGFAPDLHRAGRYGVRAESYALLREMGLTFDFSPSAGFDFSEDGGPDFSAMSNHPFRVVSTDEKTPTDIFVTPVCAGHAVKYTRTFRKRGHGLGFSKARHANRISPSSISIPNSVATVPLRLSPEGANLDDLRALTRFLLNDPVPILTFTFHSTSLTPGATGYTRSQDDVDRFLDLCTQYFTMFREDFGGDFISADDLRSLYRSRHTKNRLPRARSKAV